MAISFWVIAIVVRDAAFNETVIAIPVSGIALSKTAIAVLGMVVFPIGEVPFNGTILTIYTL